MCIYGGHILTKYIDNLNELIKISYKKLKANVYYDKTLLPLRQNIVEFELNNLDDKFKDMIDLLQDKSETNWKIYENKILDSISVLSFPKKLSLPEKNSIIFNKDYEKIKIDKIQDFIDMSVEGHILGIMWILLIGKEIDAEIYDHSYGNRLKKTLINKDSEDITYSPHLFQPYFSQYSTWRDKGLEQAQKCLDLGQDTMILTLDFKEFFYSLNMTHCDFENFSKYYDDNNIWAKRINFFVFNVIKKYSEKFKDIYEKRLFLPIGFFPSNILSNWYLNKFDQHIITRWNPIYYGRYVDDIIIVDKIEKNSHLYKKDKHETNFTEYKNITKNYIIEYYLCNCNSTKKDEPKCKNENKCLIPSTSNNDNIIYTVNSNLLLNDKCSLEINSEKVKIFYFKKGSSEALLRCFKSKIAHNVSEFRLLPDDEAILKNDDYSELFNLETSDTLHKLRAVERISTDRFALSKFLGKYSRIVGLINNKEKSCFEKDMLKIFDKRMLIENYTVWEKLFEILIINNRADQLKYLAKKLLDAIYSIENASLKEYYNEKCKYGLLLVFFSALTRTLSLSWSSSVDNLLGEILEYAEINDKKYDCKYIPNFKIKKIQEIRLGYILTRMIDKYAMPILVDGILDYKLLKNDLKLKKKLKNYIVSCDLYSLDNMPSKLLKKDNILECKYIYYPYMITPQEIVYTLSIIEIKNEACLSSPLKLLKKTNSLYFSLNYGNIKYIGLESIMSKNIEIKDLSSNMIGNHISAIKAGNKFNKKLRIGIANARLKETDVENLLRNRPNRSYERYLELSKLITEALNEKTDLLVLPECYLPIDWLPVVSRVCAKNQMALVTGIEQVISSNKESEDEHKIFNLTAIVLPYQVDEYKFTHICFHQKVHFSPNEKRMIKGYRYLPAEGDAYQLFNWNNIWFSVYCCFELASIKERALFQSYADMMIAVEWNRDTNYYSSIIESLSRDLHCYCVQVNSANYGDSRITQPSNTETRDILRTKGGINKTVLVEDVNIDQLRDFQRKEFELQRDEGSFKPTPPLFDIKILEQKINGTLWDNLPEKTNLTSK